MALHSTRTSQILPTVRCSRCNAEIAMDDMATHICTTSAKDLPAILESPTSLRQQATKGFAQQRRIDVPRPTAMERSLFDSAKYAVRGPAHASPENANLQPAALHSNPADTTNFDDPYLHAPRQHPQQQKHQLQQRPAAYASANAVLGRLNNIKPGVLDSDGTMHRPIQQSRQGPVQTRDPRATIVPIRSDAGQRYGPVDQGRSQGYGRPAVDQRQQLPQHHRQFSHSQDDAASIASGRSQRSAGQPSETLADMMYDNERQGLAGSADAGPYHNVGTKLDPSIFIADDERPGSSRSKKSAGNGRFRPNRRDKYDADWEERGFEDDSSLYSREDDLRPPSSRGNMSSRGSTFSETSSHSQRSQPGRPSQGRLPPAHQQNQQQHMRSLYEDPTQGLVSARPGPQRFGQQQQQQPRYAQQRQVVHDGGQARLRERPDHRAAPSMSNEAYLQLPPPQPPGRSTRDQQAPSRPSMEQVPMSHAKHTTGSSLGTLLTNTSERSLRSSTSSPPTSEWNYTDREVRRPEVITPIARQDYKDDLTPRVTLVEPLKETGMTKSSTTESFDRLLQDIGSSIDELQVPTAPFGAFDNSPSSNYSPIVPTFDKLADRAAPARNDDDNLPPPRRLGSPASLRSKETVSSRDDRPGAHARNRSRAEVRCRACEHPIIGKSIASADGKLSGRYHRDCFRCHDPNCGGSNFPGGEFYVFDDRPYCAVHYHERAGSVCRKCGSGIEGECIATRDGARFHLHCHTSRHVKGRSYDHF